MLRKKGRYIILILIIFSIWHYYNEKKREKYLIKKEIHQLIDAIRVQDYDAIYAKLDKNISQRISLDSIQKFANSFDISRDFKIELKDYDDNKIEGLIKNSNEHNFTIERVEYNNTYYFKNISIGNKILKPENFSFPVK